MNACRFLKVPALLFPTLVLALGSLLRAEGPSAPVAPPPAPVAVTPPAAVPDEVAARLADQARAEAERIAEQARIAAQQAVDGAAAQAAEQVEKAQAAADTSTQEAEEAAIQAAAEDAKPKKSRGHSHKDDDSADRVMVGSDNHVPADMVVAGEAVAVLGDLTVDGEVRNDAVAVFGDSTINGHVQGNAVTVLGAMTLGPKARIDGDLVLVGSQLRRDPGAIVKGQVQFTAINTKIPQFDSLASWWEHALKLGRPLAIGAHLAWLWIVTAFSVAFYALLGLIFPNKLRACGDRFAQQPGQAILAGVLGILALPVLFVLLLITIVGIPVALFVLPAGLLLVTMFGKAALYGLVGRRLSGDRLHPALAVLLGAGVFILLFLIPYIGLLLSLLIWFLGFGCALLAIFSRSPKPEPAAPAYGTPPPLAPPPAAPGAQPPVASASAPAAAPGIVLSLAAASDATVAGAPESVPATAGGEPAPATAAAASSAPATPAPETVVPPAPPAPVALTADTLPRAGFWIRLGASFLDFLLICIPAGILGLFHYGPGLPFLLLTTYHVLMWRSKATTIGGSICGLKVVRLDDRPLDWSIAIVRALTAFLSFMPFGLGFIWVAFDDGRQSWHDKVAGTTLVRVTKGTALL